MRTPTREPAASSWGCMGRGCRARGASGQITGEVQVLEGGRSGVALCIMRLEMFCEEYAVTGCPSVSFWCQDGTLSRCWAAGQAAPTPCPWSLVALIDR